MDKLIHVSLINWYLFAAQDIPIDGDIILFRGANGAGKSSLLDALQALFAGGDENELLMNAASSDGRRSGRSLRSYILGMVADNSGDDIIESRQEASSYILASFKRGQPLGHKSDFYSIGLGLHGKKSDQKVSKHRFIVDGRVLTTKDAVTEEGYVRPWKTFERCILDEKGQVTLPMTAIEFRQHIADVMSAPGLDHKISPNAMLRALKKGIGFKEQKCISQFTKEHVLPENSIDVLRVQNDYDEYRRIYDLMDGAKHRLQVLNKMMTAFESGVSHSQQSVVCDWCFYQIQVEVAVDQLLKQQQALQCSQESILLVQTQLDQLALHTLEVQNARDEAFSFFRQSDHFNATKSYDDKIALLQKAILESAAHLRQIQTKTEFFYGVQTPEALSQSLTQTLQQQITDFKSIVNIKQDLLNCWPQDNGHVQSINAMLCKFEPLTIELVNERDALKSKLDRGREKVAQLESALASAQSGQAKLHGTTTRLIELLASAGIDAKPVCELAKILDPDWQIGIERFLGGNREALVVDAAYYEDALKLYRKAKDQDEALRSVKLVNPDKGFGFSGKPLPGTAAELISSENYVAERFLRGLVHNVYLVDSEQELRKASRAITRDGMVAGNGAISGGNRFRWVLMGQKARRDHANYLIETLEVEKKELYQLDAFFTPFEKFNQTFFAQIDWLKQQYASIGLVFDTSLAQQTELDNLLKVRASMEINPDTKLEAQFEHAHQVLLQHQHDIRTLEIRLANEQKDAQRLSASMAEFELSLAQSKDVTVQIEADDFWCGTLATSIFLKLKESQEPSVIQRQAQEGKKASAGLAQKSIQEAQDLLAAYLVQYEPEDRQEFAALTLVERMQRCQQHRDKIQETQMLVYLEDAKQAREIMLDNFRFEVVAKLKDAFETIKATFTSLNNQLFELTFNNTQYQFVYPLVETQVLKSVYEYVCAATEQDNQEVGTLFDDMKEHPGVAIIEGVLVDGRLADISDYRNFFTYDIVASDRITGMKRFFSELLLNGSGGEKQTPFYVALGASFMTAYRIQKNKEQLIGGVGLALFDEAFSKMDGNNAQTALSFFKDIGLQVILAAPPDSEVKVGPFVDATYTILRSGGQVYLDYKKFTPAGKALLRSDEPALV